MSVADDLSSYALYGSQGLYGVTVNLAFHQKRPVVGGDQLLFRSKNTKPGRNMAYIHFGFYSSQDGALIGEGYHTKFMPLYGIENTIFRLFRADIFRDSWLADQVAAYIVTSRGGKVINDVDLSSEQAVAEWRRELNLTEKQGADGAEYDMTVTQLHTNPQMSIHGGSICQIVEEMATMYRKARGNSELSCTGLNVTIPRAGPIGNYKGRLKAHDDKRRQVRGEIWSADSKMIAFGDATFL